MTTIDRPRPPTARNARPRAVAIVLQILLVLGAYAAFSVLAPWIAARPISEAEPAARAALPAGCPAFSVSHGDYACIERGLASDHPWRIALLVLATLAALSAAVGLQCIGRRPAPSHSAREENRP